MVKAKRKLEKGDRLLSWLAYEDDDVRYPWKNAIFVKYGVDGYWQTSWKMSREDIIAYNAKSGFSDQDRIETECKAIALSAHKNIEVLDLDVKTVDELLLVIEKRLRGIISTFEGESPEGSAQDYIYDLYDKVTQQTSKIRRSDND